MRLKSFETTEEILNEVAPFAGLGVDLARRHPVGVLRDHGLGAALIKFFDDPVDVERLVRDYASEVDPVDQPRDTDRVVALSGQKAEVDKIAKCIRQPGFPN